ncbi:MAG: TatD family hydrolase [Gammaproteobacteria bacterium]|nr:TatD family hydrolase [Gammaproteobacteria bacterium]
MQFVDSHCHLDRLDLSKYDGELSNAIAAAQAEGVERFLCVSIDFENFPAVLNCAEQFDSVYASVGVHPNEEGREEPTVEKLVALADHSKVIAIGETGLDFFRSEEDTEWQKERFRTHIRAAKLTHKPLIIHSREARDETLKIMREEGADQVGGIMHCFVEDLETAKAAIDMGFYISFSGIVTFNSAKDLQEVAIAVPDEWYLIETDSPYLAPVPFRGKPNQPLYVKHVAEKLAELREESVETIAKQSWNNFNRLFSLNG